MKDHFDLRGKVALITGGSRGLGRAMAFAFAERGARLVIASRKLEQVEETAEALRATGAEVLGLACHVADWDQCDALFDAAIAHYGRVDILVNNAGMSPLYPDLESVSEALFDKVVGVNLKGPFRLMARAGTHMAAGDGGGIINISSINGRKGQMGQTNYSAAKAGMHGFTMALAQEMANKGVTVNTVSPGYIGTDMVRAIRPDVLEKIVGTVPVKRLGEPSEIGSIVAWLASEEGGYATGADFSVNGGLHMG